MSQLLRMQDGDGRGPWRPGFSKFWMTDGTPTVGRPITAEPRAMMTAAKAHQRGLYLGCAFRPERRTIWFANNDIDRLLSLGFRIVDASKCEVLFESFEQVLIGCQFPLKFLPPAVILPTTPQEPR